MLFDFLKKSHNKVFSDQEVKKEEEYLDYDLIYYLDIKVNTEGCARALDMITEFLYQLFR